MVYSLLLLHLSSLGTAIHADSLLWNRNLLQRQSYGHVDIPRLQASNVALQVFTVVTKVPSQLNLERNSGQSDDITKLAIAQGWPLSTWFSLKQRASYQASKLQKVAAQSNGQFRFIKTAEDLNTFVLQRQQNPQLTAGILGLEGAHALEGKLENVDKLYNLGFRVLGLAHFFDNEVGGSAHGEEKGGLTPFGKQVLQRTESLPMLIDLAHASPQMIDEVLQIATQPVVVSHTGVKGTCDGIRNLSDDQIQRIAAKGGLIGIGFWKTAVCGREAKDIVRAIRYVTDLAGVDAVALGSDFDGAVRQPFDVTGLVLITEALLEDGFTESEIRKIMGLNTIRVLQQILPSE